MEEKSVENENTIQMPLQNNDMKLVDLHIKDQNTALNVMISFLTLAQRRGNFSFDESAKIWECIKMFIKNEK